MGWLLYLSFICITLVCFIAYSRLNAIEAVRTSSSVQESTPVEFEVQEPNRRRLTETEVTAPNPFMDGVCMDFIQDNTLDVAVNAFSAIIVARNEDKSALLKTVSKEKLSSATSSYFFLIIFSYVFR